MQISKKNNTKALQREIAKKLSKSTAWLVLREDQQGVHLHTPNEEHLSVLVAFFHARPDFLKHLNELVTDLQKRA